MKKSYIWKSNTSISIIKIEPMIFFNCYFTGGKQYYRSSELEIVYLIWAYKRLYILLCLNNRYIIVFIDYNVINGIMKSTNFNTTSINRINCRLINISVYLFIYLLDVYHILGRFNLVSNVLLYLRILKNNIIWINNEVELAFDII